MNEYFYLVCAWDGYYPEGGIKNIILVTYNEEEAYKVRDECVDRGIPCPYDTDDKVRRYHRDHVRVYRSDDLPWSSKV